MGHLTQRNSGPLICLDLDPDVKPIRAPNHCEPISKLDAIKAALDAYETTCQPVRVSQPKAKTNPHQTGKIRSCLDPSQPLNKAIRCPKYIISTLEENIHKLHGRNTCQIGKTYPCP